MFNLRIYFYIVLIYIVSVAWCCGSSLSYQFYIGNNKPIAEIGNTYGQKLGFLDQNNNAGGPGNSGSNAKNFSISNDFQIGIRSLKSITYNTYIKTDIILDLALGSTTLFFEEGIGIFVEPIKVSSINIEIEPSVSLRYDAFDRLNVFGGISYSSIWTDDTFHAGNWRIKEQLNFGSVYSFIGIQYDIIPLDLILEAKVLNSSALSTYSVRILREIKLPTNIFE